jgi:hypothetical protein
MEGIEHQQHSVRSRRSGHFTVKDIDRYASVFRVRIQAVDARQIDKREVAPAYPAQLSKVLLDSNSGIIRNLLPKTRKTIEQR